jgi:hypothetical protein
MYTRLAAELGISTGKLPPFFSKLWKNVCESGCAMDAEPSDGVAVMTKTTANTPKKTSKLKADNEPANVAEKKKSKKGRKADEVRVEEASERAVQRVANYADVDDAEY